MSVRNLPPYNKVLILLAPGFEEGATVYCLDRMREAGLPVSLVGLSAGLVNGLHGLNVRPDHSLDQLSPAALCRLVVLPGGLQCVSTLLTDPRVHRLLGKTITNDGFVAALLPSPSLLVNAGIPVEASTSKFAIQGDLEMVAFVDKLINLVSN